MKRPRHTRLALLAFGVFALAACEDSVQFRLRFEWQRDTADGSAQACPRAGNGDYTCSAIPISCDVRVRVRIVGATNDETYYSDCFAIENPGTACQLTDIPIAPRAIPNEMVRIQVIMWTLDELMDSRIDLSETDGCPVTTPFDAGGLPRLGGTPVQPGAPREPVPAIGGESYFLVGQSPIATITLGCPQFPSLDAPECRDNSQRIQATILDPSDGLSVDRPQIEEMMVVRYGVPEKKEGVYRIVDTKLSPVLAETREGTLVWNGILTEAPGEVGCMVASKLGAGSPSLHCFNTDIPDEGPMMTQGYLTSGMLQNSLESMLMLDNVPRSGLVLGVVLDSDGTPVKGATVTPSQGTVIYPDDLIFGQGSSTNNKGFFVSLDAGYETTWSAVGPNNVEDDGTARGGLVDFHVSIVVIRLVGEVPAPQQ